MRLHIAFAIIMLSVGCSKSSIEQAEASPDRPATELITGVKASRPKLTPQAMMDKLDRIEALLTSQQEAKDRETKQLIEFQACSKTCSQLPFEEDRERSARTKCYERCEAIAPLNYQGC